MATISGPDDQLKIGSKSLAQLEIIKVLVFDM